MYSIEIDIDRCPICKSDDCVSWFVSDYVSGTIHIDCSKCNKSRTLVHKKDENGYFIWKGETNESSIENLISEGILTDCDYAEYNIECGHGGTDRGLLTSKEAIDNFLSYIESLTEQEHNIKKVEIIKKPGNEVLLKQKF